MPFDPAPRVKTRFQEFADAMLRGCAATTPHRCSLYYADAQGTRGACAIGAYYLGMGLPFGEMPTKDLSAEANQVSTAYEKAYRSWPAADNDEGPYTREEIAARIAAL